MAAVADRLASKGWQGLHFVADGRRVNIECPNCRKAITHTGVLGFGLSYCKPCRIAIGVIVHNHKVGDGVQQRAGYLKCSLYELVEQHPAEMEALSWAP